MEDRELRDRLRMAGYLSERDRQDDGHASGNGPYPMRGSMTSEEYIIKLMQTIESLDSLVRDLRGEISFLGDELARLREKEADHDAERRRLMKMIEAKDEDMRKMADKMTDLLGKVDVLAKALEDKTHQLTNRNRGQFGTKTNRTNARKNLKGRDDDHEDYSASSDTDTEKQAEGVLDSESHSVAEESKPLDKPKSDIQNPMDISEFELKYGKERPDTYESAHADRVVRFGCDLSQVRGTIVSETVRKVFEQVSYKEERQYVFITSQWEEPVYDETGKVIDYVIRQETMHYPMKEDMQTPGAAQEPIARMDRLPGMTGGRFMTASMIADIIFQYLVCLTPINRQVMAMQETGLTINRQTVIDIYHAIGYMLEPVYEALKKKVMARDAFLNCDETWFRLNLKEGSKKGYIWIMANKELDCMYYFYDDGSRARSVLQEMIGDSNIKAVMSDGYVAYRHLDADDSKVEHLADLAHIRTKFMDWLLVAPDEEVADMIRDFNELFRMERGYGELTYEQIVDARTGPETMEVLQRIADRLTRLEKRMDESEEGIPKVGERAVNYMKNLWESVLKWCRDGRYSLSNNLAERCARPVALLRKNIMHFGSHKGAEVYAILASLVESCRMVKKPILRYLERVIQEINDGNKDYDSLLPGVITL